MGIIWSGAMYGTPIQFVTIGVNGLTCSMCTRSVEMSMRKLDFVDSVAMDLANTEGRVYIKQGSLPDFKRIAHAITDAGFSVRFIHVNLDVQVLAVSPEGCFSIGQQLFQWIDLPAAFPKGIVELIVVGEGLMPRKEFMARKKSLPRACSGGVANYVASR